jgi:superfamily II DNA or RNA helicase
MPTTLFHHQQAFLDTHKNKCLLAWQTGTGKSLAAIEWAKLRGGSCIVVVPKALKEKWRRDVKKYHAESMSWDVMSKEEFRSMWDKLIKPTSIIWDEAHAVSGINSLMAKNFYKFLKKHKLENILLLTATPYLSTPWNIYTLARHLGYNWNYMDFRQTFFQDRYIGRRVVPEVKEGIEPAIAALVAGIGDVVRLDECVDVPDQVVESEMFKMTPAQEAAKKSVIDINPIVRFTKYHEIESGVLKDDGYGTDKFFDCDKLDRILEYCATSPKVAIVCRYNLQIDAIYKALGQTDLGQYTHIIRGETKHRDDIVQAVEQADRAIVIINAACCEGYQLPTVPLILFASLSFSYVHYKQMLGRFVRIDNLRKHVYIHLVTAGGIDQDIYTNIVHEKQSFDLAIYAREKMG